MLLWTKYSLFIVIDGKCDVLYNGIACIWFQSGQNGVYEF